MEIALYDYVYWPLAQTIYDAINSEPRPESITLRVNSFGGDLFEGLAVYNVLKSSGIPVTVIVDGVAASAASLIAMAATKVVMSPGARMMIHEPWSMTAGNSDALSKESLFLQSVNGDMATIYAARSKQELSAVLTMLKEETWMDGPTAVSLGFADEVAAIDAPPPEETADEASAPEVPVAVALSEVTPRFRNLPKELKVPTRIAASVRPATPTGEAEAKWVALEGQLRAEMGQLKTRLEVATTELETERAERATEAAKLAVFEAAEAARAEEQKTAQAQAVVANAIKAGKWVPSMNAWAKGRSAEEIQALVETLPVILPVATPAPKNSGHSASVDELLAPPKSPTWAFETNYFDRRAQLRRERPELFESTEPTTAP